MAVEIPLIIFIVLGELPKGISALEINQTCNRRFFRHQPFYSAGVFLLLGFKVYSVGIPIILRRLSSIWVWCINWHTICMYNLAFIYFMLNLQLKRFAQIFLLFVKYLKNRMLKSKGFSPKTPFTFLVIKSLLFCIATYHYLL